MKISISLYCKVKTKFSSNDKRQLIADLEIKKYSCMANLPFTHVASDVFKELMAYTIPEVNLKAPPTYSRSKLPILYQNIWEAVLIILKKDLQNVNAVGFTTDLWSSRSNDAYAASTLHYINSSYEHKYFLLGCVAFPERHTGDNIALKTDAIISEISFKPNCEMTYVSDSASDMLSAMKKSLIINENTTCNAYMLYLVITQGVSSVEEVNETSKLVNSLLQEHTSQLLVRGEYLMSAVKKKLTLKKLSHHARRDGIVGLFAWALFYISNQHLKL